MAERQLNFRNERDECINQIAATGHRCGWWEPAVVHRLNETTDEYIYRDENCEWAFEIDRQSRTVRSWRYISHPDHCYINTDWFGAW